MQPAQQRAVLLLAVLCACGGRATPLEADGDAAAADGGPSDGGPYCECPSDMPAPDRPTFMYHECVPPLLFGCEAQPCTPGDDDCPAGTRCDEWGAAACCFCAAVVPACLPSVPEMGPLPEYLAIQPVYGPAGEAQVVDVTGFPFYVGALSYAARLGDSAELLEPALGDTCVQSVRLPARSAGTVPLWLSQYGGGEPWVLAGFFTYGAESTTCTQPGYPCGEGSAVACCETPDVPMTCRHGRCLRQ